MTNPRNYWTKEKCQEIAINYNIKSDFNKNNHTVYMTAYKNNWLNDICSHMIQNIKPAGFWTKDECQKVALICNSRKEFGIKYTSAYNTSRKNKWLDDICIHMNKNINEKGYWTKEKCQEVALTCNSRKEFNEKFNSAYVTSSKNNWLTDICSHMKWKTKPMYYWTKEKCQDAALKCNSRFEFQTKYGRAYRVSYDNNWLYDMTSHMKILGNIFKRLIYLYEFSDNFVYIGLTCNIERRNNEHINKNIHSSVYNHILKTGLQPVYKKLTEYLDVNIAADVEKIYIEKFEKLGYNLLNKKKGGGLGVGYIKWTYENCKNEALKYKTKTLFCKHKGRAYRKSVKENWLNDFYPNNSL